MIDSNTIYILSGKLIVGALFFIRILGFLSSGPIFKSKAIPMQVKVFLGVILAVSVTTAYWTDQPVIDFHLFNIVLLVLKEFMVGILIGFSASAVFWGARLAGGLIDFDLGYHTSVAFNIEEGAPTIVGELKYMMVLMIFLGINGHHTMIDAMFTSVQAVPLTTFEITTSTLRLLIQFATEVMIIGVKLSGPVLVAIFVTNLGLALLARVAPQTNVFILSFQLKIVVGILVMFASISLVAMVSKYSLQDIGTDMVRFLMSVNPFRV